MGCGIEGGCKHTSSRSVHSGSALMCLRCKPMPLTLALHNIRCIEGCETRTTRANLAQHEAACKASTARILELEATLEAHELKVSALKQALARSKAALEAIRDDNTEIRVPRPVRRRRRPQRMVGLPQEELSNEDKATPSTPDKIPKLEAVPDDTALNPLPSPAATQRLFRTRSSSVSPALPDVKKPRLLSTD